MFDHIFPTTIYHDILEEEKENKQKYLDEIYKIKEEIISEGIKNKIESTTFTSFRNKRIDRNEIFFPLFSKCILHVGKFAEHFSANFSDIMMTDAWFNIAGYKDSQEYHIHPNNHFSMTYYVNAPKDSGRITFKNPEALTDMFYFSIEYWDEVNYKTYSYEPSDSAFLIYKSNLQHMVEPHMLEEERVSISMNFMLVSD